MAKRHKQNQRTVRLSAMTAPDVRTEGQPALDKSQLQKVADDTPGFARITSTHSTFRTAAVRQLTPKKLQQILSDADAGDWQAQCEVFSYMEEFDPHIHAEMSKRRRAILSVERNVQAADDPTEQEVEQARWLQNVIERIPDFEDVLVNALDAIGHAFSCQELTYGALQKDAKQGFYYKAPIKVSWVPPELFRLDRDALTPGDRDAIRLRDLSTEGLPLTADKWIVHIHRSRAANIQRAGLYRTLIWPFLFKHYAITDLAEFLEIYGLPMRVGTYSASAGDADKRTLLRSLVALGHDAAAVIPEGTMIDFKEAADGKSLEFLTMAEYMDRSISKAILGGTLTSQSGGSSGGGGGAFALGKVHQDVARDILAADARQLASTLNRDLIEPMMRMTFGVVDQSRMPRFVFEMQEPEDVALWSDALPKLVGMGMKIPLDWTHTKLQIPHADKDDAVLVIGNAGKPLQDGNKGANLTALLKAQTLAKPNAEAARSEAMTEALAAAAAKPLANTLADIQALVDNAVDLVSLKANLLDLYGSMQPDDMGKVMEAAFALAALRGVDAVQTETGIKP